MTVLIMNMSMSTGLVITVVVVAAVLMVAALVVGRIRGGAQHEREQDARRDEDTERGSLTG